MAIRRESATFCQSLLSALEQAICLRGKMHKIILCNFIFRSSAKEDFHVFAYMRQLCIGLPTMALRRALLECHTLYLLLPVKSLSSQLNRLCKRLLSFTGVAAGCVVNRGAG
jgi:hypothetical protein